MHLDSTKILHEFFVFGCIDCLAGKEKEIKYPLGIVSVTVANSKIQIMYTSTVLILQNKNEWHLIECILTKDYA